VDNEFERMWKETVVAIFKVLSLYLPGGTKKKVWTDDVPADIRKRRLPN